jgi:hypothetical protein
LVATGGCRAELAEETAGVATWRAAGGAGLRRTATSRRGGEAVIEVAEETAGEAETVTREGADLSSDRVAGSCGGERARAGFRRTRSSKTRTYRTTDRRARQHSLVASGRANRIGVRGRLYHCVPESLVRLGCGYLRLAILGHGIVEGGAEPAEEIAYATGH